MVFDTYACARIMLVYVALKGRKTQLIAIFKVAIVLGKLLNRVVSEMHECVINVLQIDTKLT